MRNLEFLAPLVKPAATVFITVAICVAVLFAVQPWQSQTRDEHGTSNLSANVKSAAILASSPEPAVKSAREITAATLSVQAPKPVQAEVITASVKKPEAARIPPPPERVLTRETEAGDNEAESAEAGDDQSAATGEELETSLQQAEEDPDFPTLPVRAPHQQERLLKKQEKRSEQFSAPWNKAESDAALEPLLSYDISQDDIEALKAFVDLAFKQKFSEAAKYQAKLKDPIARKFARWYSYRNKAPDVEPAEIIEFIDNNPLWPGREDTEAAVEDALFWREKSTDVILSYFSGREPASGTGLAALGTALIKTGRQEDGVKRIRQAWRLHVLTPAVEKEIRKLKVLDGEDHYARAGFLLMQGSKSNISAVKRILPLVGKDRQQAVKAHIATVQRAGNAGKLLTALDAKVKEEPAILFARVQWLRRAKNDDAARELLKSAPKTAEALIDSEQWWKERQLHIRSALDEGKADIAYQLASGPNAGLEHWDLSEAESLAGWIAFRYLNKPDIARKHFLAASAAGGLPKRRSRAAYWLGRIETEAGNHNEARARYTEASEHHHTFYGQLAHQMIGGPDALLTFRNYTRPTRSDIEQFAAQDVMQAMVIADRADFENLLSLFMYDLARTIESAPQMILLSELASRIAPPHHTVRMAKIAVNRDFPVEHYAYPLALPEFSAIASGQDVDDALIHALTRQESEFNPGIVSPAGAVGLMQLLPSTAKMVARRHNVDYAKQKLSSDPAYNVSLGSAFLYQLIGNYDGSYIMALAGYNAGPGRVSRWSKELGDPRDSKIDPVDWIERIPFTETRDYVHKILESVQVYRSRLLDDNAPIRLAEDLHRGRSDKPKFLADQTASN